MLKRANLSRRDYGVDALLIQIYLRFRISASSLTWFQSETQELNSNQVRFLKSYECLILGNQGAQNETEGCPK